MLISLLLVFTLVVSGSGTLNGDGRLSQYQGIPVDVFRLYTVIISQLQAKFPNPEKLMDDFLLQGPTIDALLKLRNRTLGLAATRLSEEELAKLLQGINRLRNSPCARNLAVIGRYLKKAINISDSCHLHQHPNKTLQWDCDPNSNIRRLQELSWVFSLFDSWGRPSPGLSSQGQFLWYGDYRQCLNTVVPDAKLRFSSAQYCMLQSGNLEMQMSVEPESDLKDIQISRLPLIFKIGICLPKTCGSVEINQVLGFVDVLLGESGLNETSNLPDFDVSTHCSENLEKISFSVGGIITMVGTSFLTLMVIIGTAMDWCEEKRCFKQKSRTRQFIRPKKKSKPATRVSPTSRLMRKTELEDPLSFKSLTSVRRTLKNPRCWLKILIAFSLRLNLAWIFQGEVLQRGRNGRYRYHRSTDPRGDHVTCLFGLKVLSMIWIIVGHTHLFAVGSIGNMAVFAENFKENLMAQLVLNASLSVDTFFFISGFLVTYVWYRRTERNSGSNIRKPQSWLLFYFHRLIRLLPAYALILGFTIHLYPKLGSGPNWNPEILFGAQCTDNDWWRHLLFLTNILPSACLPWMWFLAVEMQLYLVTPLFLVLFWKSRSWGVVVVFGSVLLSGVGRGMRMADQNYPPNLLLLLPANFNRDIQSFFYSVYAMPYMRAGPFLIGIAFGWRLAVDGHRLGRLRFRERWKIRVYWALALCLGFWCIFGAYPLYLGYNNPIYNFVLGAFSRTLWAFAVGMTVELCHTDSGNVINKILSWTGWRPFSRLTYSAYLCHELIQLGFYQSANFPIMYEGWTQMTIYAMGFVLLGYAAALPLNLLAESPPLALERLLFKRYPKLSRKEIKTKKPELFPSVCRRERVNGWIQNPDFKIADMPEPSLSEICTEETDPTQKSPSNDTLLDTSQSTIGDSDKSQFYKSEEEFWMNEGRNLELDITQPSNVLSTTTTEEEEPSHKRKSIIVTRF